MDTAFPVVPVGSSLCHDKDVAFVGYTPVSYTHLDVYKRQLTSRTISIDGRASRIIVAS